MFGDGGEGGLFSALSDIIYTIGNGKEMDIINTYHLFILKKEKIFYVSTKISLKYFQPQMQCKINVLNLTEGFNKCDFSFFRQKKY